MTARHAIAIFGLALLATGCPPSPAPPPQTPAESLAVPGLENCFRVTPNLYSGGTPVGDEGFAELQKFGVKTIISVDGLTPEVELAEKLGMTYVHIPVGYDGITSTDAYRLARAVQALPGPVYIHCHHGKHRGPAAVAAVRLALEPDYQPVHAREWLEAAGTGEEFPGLMRLPNAFRRPTPEQLAAIPAEFPSRAAVKDLTKVMTHVDGYWETILASERRNWLGAESAATLLAEEYREASRMPASGPKGEPFVRLLQAAEAAARELSAVAKAGNAKDLPAQIEKNRALCARCHKDYRN